MAKRIDESVSSNKWIEWSWIGRSVQCLPQCKAIPFESNQNAALEALYAGMVWGGN